MKTGIKYVNDFGGIQKPVTRDRLSIFSWDFQNTECPRRTECPSEDVCREVVIFSRKVLKDRVERTGRSRQADVATDGNWSRARTD